mgnify:CR=1 FL=1
MDKELERALWEISVQDDQERCADCSKPLGNITDRERVFLSENPTNRIICYRCSEWLAYADGRGPRPTPNG